MSTLQNFCFKTGDQRHKTDSKSDSIQECGMRGACEGFRKMLVPSEWGSLQFCLVITINYNVGITCLVFLDLAFQKNLEVQVFMLNAPVEKWIYSGLIYNSRICTFCVVEVNIWPNYTPIQYQPNQVIEHVCLPTKFLLAP